MSEAILKGKVTLSAWYLNTRRLSAITGINNPDAQISITQNSRRRVIAMNYWETVAQNLLLSGQIPSLTKEYDTQIRQRRVIAGTWNPFSFRGMPKAIKADYAGKPLLPAEVHGEIPIGDEIFEVRGKLYTEHVCSQSSAGYLSGRKMVYIVGQFDFDESARTAEVSPYIIGELIDHIDGALINLGRWPKRARVYPQQLDCFAKIEHLRPPTAKQMTVLQNISEDTIKHTLARIIGEQFVPKDWGGEKSDLFTSQMTLGGRPLSAAFLLKGPAIFRPLHPGDLGKRGDQIIRLFEEPADLLILQHCHQVMPTVIREMEAFAVNPANPRLFCVIDGQDTYRILKAFEALPE